MWRGRRGVLLVAGGCAVGEAGLGSSLLPGGKTVVAGDGGVGGVAVRMWRWRHLAESPAKMGGGVGDEGGGRGLLLVGGEGGGQCATDQRAREEEKATVRVSSPTLIG